MPLISQLDPADPAQGVAFVGQQGEKPVRYIYDPQYNQDTLFAYGARGDGETDDHVAVQDADDVAAEAGEVLVIRRRHYLAAGVTLNAMLRFEPGGMLIWPDGVSVTINNYIWAGPWRIFAGERLDGDAPRVYDNDDLNRLHITLPQMLLPEWFGARPVGTFNCKPALQRLSFAAPAQMGLVYQRGRTYWFDNGGLCWRNDRPSAAVFNERTHVHIEGNGATLKLMPNTKYSMMVFQTTTPIDANAPYLNYTCQQFFMRDLILDGNRAANRDFWLDQVNNGGGSNANGNKGYGALVRVAGYRWARHEGMTIANNIHSGIDFQECGSNYHLNWTAYGGEPMKYDVYQDQAHNCSTRGNFAGFSIFDNWDSVGGSHCCTHHTTLNDQDPKPQMYTQCIISNGRGRDWAEGMLHIESCESSKVTNCKGEITAVEFSSANVSDIVIRPYSRRGKRFIDVEVSGVSLVNADLNVYDELGNGNNKPGRVVIKDCILEKNLNGLSNDVRIRAQNAGRVVNCRVAGTEDTPIGLTPIDAHEIVDCTVEWAPGVATYEAFSGKLTNIVPNSDGEVGPAITANSPTRCVIDAEVDGAYCGVRHKFGEIVISGSFRNLQAMVVQDDCTDGSVLVHDALFENWGLNADASIDNPSALAAISSFDNSGDGANSPLITLDNVRFEQNDPTASKFPLRANQTPDQVVILKDCSGTPGLDRPSFVGNENCYFEAFVGHELETTELVEIDDDLEAPIGLGMVWACMRRMTLNLPAPPSGPITHLSSQSQQPATFEGVSIDIYIDSPVDFDFTAPNGADVRHQALRHVDGRASWSAASGSLIRVSWGRKYWLCQTVDA